MARHRLLEPIEVPLPEIDYTSPNTELTTGVRIADLGAAAYRAAKRHIGDDLTEVLDLPIGTPVDMFAKTEYSHSVNPVDPAQHIQTARTSYAAPALVDPFVEVLTRLGYDSMVASGGCILLTHNSTYGMTFQQQ